MVGQRHTLPLILGAYKEGFLQQGPGQAYISSQIIGLQSFLTIKVPPHRRSLSTGLSLQSADPQEDLFLAKPKAASGAQAARVYRNFGKTVSPGNLRLNGTHGYVN